MGVTSAAARSFVAAYEAASDSLRTGFEERRAALDEAFASGDPTDELIAAKAGAAPVGISEDAWGEVVRLYAATKGPAAKGEDAFESVGTPGVPWSELGAFARLLFTDDDILGRFPKMCAKNEGTPREPRLREFNGLSFWEG